MDPKPSIRVAVRIARRRRPNRWEEWGFRIAEVVLDEGGFGDAARTLRDDGRDASFLSPGLPLTLHLDEAEGYHLNLSSGAPARFVMRHIADDDPARTWPEMLTLSYNEAGRWLDAQERVDNLPLPEDVRGWLQDYTDAHEHPEPRQRRRPASFQPHVRR